MEVGKTIYLANRKKWRNWLEKNHDKEREIWLLFPNKSSGKQRIPYNDAVEEALCFGWIDSNVKRIDENLTAQRFSVRNPKSDYSQANKERLKKLIKEGKVIPEVLSTIDIKRIAEFSIPEDLLEKLKSNEKAWKNFIKFSSAYQRIRIGYVEGARKRPEEFEKRLNNLIKMNEKNKQFGFGGIEKYY
ncbi:MAG: YdeI/OmpD-associated family protein [Candidatus Humimicrobiaceae bacterium]